MMRDRETLVAHREETIHKAAANAATWVFLLPPKISLSKTISAKIIEKYSRVAFLP